MLLNTHVPGYTHLSPYAWTSEPRADVQGPRMLAHGLRRVWVLGPRVLLQQQAFQQSHGL